MDVSSVQKLCIHLISAAFQRCRVSDDLCRLSVVLRRCPSAPDPSIVRISSISDDEIYHYHLNLRESISARRLTRLPSNPKSGVKFRHAISLELSFNVAIELVVEREDVPGSLCKDVFLANECNPLPFSASNVERLKSGLEDYVLKHGNTLQGMCDSCFPSCYAPDLARSITGLILSSNDSEFQGECLTLLGLQSQHIDGETVEGCINEKIVSVIEMNDRKPRKSKEVAAPFLFEDDGLQELNLQDEEYDTGEHLLNPLDLF
ncbi:hypothetical protein LWI29_025412 [Acer saccharum]|uniref:Uncharacterized protein n=1 Tax=Acer saccharum TaxID=4024 RepID=A0AA39UW07_ACESA|nr:hypothetical protein LWI29_025412 [Acer saccharum]